MRSWIGLLGLLPLTLSAAIYQSTDGNNHIVFSDQPSMHAKAVTLSTTASTHLPTVTAPLPTVTPASEQPEVKLQIITPVTDTKVWLGGKPLPVTAMLSALPTQTTAELHYDGKILKTQAVTSTTVQFTLSYHTAGKHSVQIVIKQNSSREVLATSQLVDFYVLVHRPMLKGTN